MWDLTTTLTPTPHPAFGRLCYSYRRSVPPGPKRHPTPALQRPHIGVLISAIAGQISIRSLTGTVFPLFTDVNVDVNWASTLLEGITGLFTLIPLFYRYASRIRSVAPYTDRNVPQGVEKGAAGERGECRTIFRLHCSS